MAKKLTAAELNKLGAKYNEFKTVTIGEYEIRLQKLFQETKIESIVLEYLSYLQLLKEQPEVDLDLTKDTLSILHTLVLREFTDIPVPKKNKKTKPLSYLGSLIKVTHILIDEGIYVELLNNISDEEIAKVEAKLNATAKTAGQLLGELAIKNAIEVEDGVENEIVQ
ncbi:hypothetical protein F4V43_02560 [Paenibacillus spiritus]|uniref:Uncharacterized protein n=1 Tax=Paenibacillus spiritus TaxID=2496557 RepID=A0A5J5GGQ2_9BACL|nr:hypothetical protein [Paenibacillus spiritus]KAA9007389.1 hypothetical protein F4V43_02560 [Paenibacillus spiritus]